MRIIKQDLFIHIYSSGTWCIVWYKNELCHREDGPSNIWIDGDEYYCLNGKTYFKDKYWKKVYANY